VGLPALENPGQQRGEAGGDLELVAVPARLGLGRLVEFLESGAEGVEPDVQQGDQGGDDAVEPAPLSQDHAEAVKGQDGELRPRELGKSGGGLSGPLVQRRMARQERFLLDEGRWCPTRTRRKPHARPTGDPPSVSPTRYLASG